MGYPRSATWLEAGNPHRVEQFDIFLSMAVPTHAASKDKKLNEAMKQVTTPLEAN
jgi:hypothetical protein